MRGEGEPTGGVPSPMQVYRQCVNSAVGTLMRLDSENPYYLWSPDGWSDPKERDHDRRPHGSPLHSRGVLKCGLSECTSIHHRVIGGAAAAIEAPQRC
jgi:hypothetical protein